MEFSILKQRLARRLEFEGHTDASVEALSLVELTKVRQCWKEGLSQNSTQNIPCIQPSRLFTQTSLIHLSSTHN